MSYRRGSVAVGYHQQWYEFCSPAAMLHMLLHQAHHRSVSHTGCIHLCKCRRLHMSALKKELQIIEQWSYFIGQNMSNPLYSMSTSFSTHCYEGNSLFSDLWPCCTVLEDAPFPPCCTFAMPAPPHDQLEGLLLARMSPCMLVCVHIGRRSTY